MSAVVGSLVGLCRDRMARRRAPRLAWLVAGLLALLAAVEAADLWGATAGSAARFLTRIVRWALWGVAGPMAWEAAASPHDRDRRDGVEALTRLGLGSARDLPIARAAAVGVSTTVRVLVPTGVASVAALVASGGSATGAAVGAFVAGVAGAWLVALLGVACGALAGERGRTLLVAAVALPWAAGGALGSHANIPAGLQRLIAALTGAS